MAYQLDKIKLKKYLKAELKREPKVDEVVNAETDMMLVMKVLMEDMDELPARVIELEKKVKIVEDKIK